MQSDRAFQMMPAIIEWCVGPPLVGEPQSIGETARRQAAALHPTASLRLSLGQEIVVPAAFNRHLCEAADWKIR